MAAADGTAEPAYRDQLLAAGPGMRRAPANGTPMIDLGRVLVCGAGGFIGGHLVRQLHAQGVSHIRAVDKKSASDWQQPELASLPRVEYVCADLEDKKNCLLATSNIDTVFQLAADMGGMGFISRHKTLCMLSVLINTHMLMAATVSGVTRFFYASSACVYNVDKQKQSRGAPLTEADAYPAMPEDGYGWEKLFSERMCRHFEEDYGLECRIARLHNVYGPYGTWTGGREKAPAAICRKVIQAKISGKHEIEIWGDGAQSRSFMYIDDCLTGIDKLVRSRVREPLNLGSSESVTINQLVDLAERFADIRLKRIYNREAPVGVNGRNSDNTKIGWYLGWEPMIRLQDGLAKTYAWIEKEMLQEKKAAAF